MNFSRITRRVAEVKRDRGIRGLVFAALAEAGYRRLIVREFPLRSPVEAIRAKIDITISRLTVADIDEYNAFRSPKRPEGTAERLNNGDVCFIGRYRGHIVGTCWVAKGNAWSEFLRAPVALAPDEAYGYDLYTSPEWRGNGLPAAITSEMHRWCRAQGFSRMVGFTIPENRPAMTGSIGYRSIGLIGYAGFGKLRWQFCRMNAGERAPGQLASAPMEWDANLEALETRGHYLDDFLARMKRQAYLDLIAEWGGVPENGRVLKTDLFEEAMGPDAFFLDLPSSSTLLIGMDVSRVAASRAQARDERKRAAYVTADTRSLPFADGAIDMIVSPSTLDHFPDEFALDESLQELRRVLAPSGRMIVTLDNRQNVFDPLLRLANRAGLVPYFLGRSYTIGELQQRLQSAGFDVADKTAIIHHPRLTALAATALARRLGFSPFTRFVQQSLLRFQKLKRTRWQYFSGCFVAALAVPRQAADSSSAADDEKMVRVA